MPWLRSPNEKKNSLDVSSVYSVGLCFLSFSSFFWNSGKLKRRNLFTSYANTFWCLQVCLHNKDNSTSFIKKYIHRRGAREYIKLCNAKWQNEEEEPDECKEAWDVQSFKASLSLPLHQAEGLRKKKRWESRKCCYICPSSSFPFSAFSGEPSMLSCVDSGRTRQ